MNVIKFLLLFFISVVTMAQQPITDNVLAENLKTVLLYAYNPTASGSAQTLSPPVKSLYDSNPFVLEFDDLNAEYNQYHVKLIHCTSQWQPSDISDLDYLNDFNDFIINQYQISQNTKIQYYHYKFVVPAVKISGNYIVQVFEDYRLSEPIITKRMMVYEPLAQPIARIHTPQDATIWRTHQQLDFEIKYPNYNVRSARQEFKVMVRKNYDWHQLKTDLKPSSDNAASATLFFHFYNNEGVFDGGNEFRYFDIRSTYTRGVGVEFTRQGAFDEVWLRIQGYRGGISFTDQKDYNGMFVIENREKQNPATSCDYVWVNAQFRPSPDDNNELYILGAFNNWQADNASLMEYDASSKLLTKRFLLKQGIYDYLFAARKADGSLDYTAYEGNFSDTENSFEIFVYHHPPASRAEKLIGYAVFNSRIRD